MAFAGAPVQPVARRFGKLQGGAEGFDLLPLTARYIDVQAVQGSIKGMDR